MVERLMISNKMLMTRQGSQAEDGNHRELKDDREGAEAKESKHGEAKQDCPVDVLNFFSFSHL